MGANSPLHHQLRIVGFGDGFALFQNGFGGVHVFDFVHKLQTDADIEALDSAFNARDESRTGAQFVHAKADEQRSEGDFPSHFPADANP